MNKIFLLILLSSFILIGMDKNQVLEPDVSMSSKNISFSPQALEKLALSQQLIASSQAGQAQISPPKFHSVNKNFHLV